MKKTFSERTRARQTKDSEQNANKTDGSDEKKEDVKKPAIVRRKDLSQLFKIDSIKKTLLKLTKKRERSQKEYFQKYTDFMNSFRLFDSSKNLNDEIPGCFQSPPFPPDTSANKEFLAEYMRENSARKGKSMHKLTRKDKKTGASPPPKRTVFKPPEDAAKEGKGGPPPTHKPKQTMNGLKALFRAKNNHTYAKRSVCVSRQNPPPPQAESNQPEAKNGQPTNSSGGAAGPKVSLAKGRYSELHPKARPKGKPIPSLKKDDRVGTGTTSTTDPKKEVGSAVKPSESSSSVSVTTNRNAEAGRYSCANGGPLAEVHAVTPPPCSDHSIGRHSDQHQHRRGKVASRRKRHKDGKGSGKIMTKSYLISGKAVGYSSPNCCTSPSSLQPIGTDSLKGNQDTREGPTAQPTKVTVVSVRSFPSNLFHPDWDETDNVPQMNDTGIADNRRTRTDNTTSTGETKETIQLATTDKGGRVMTEEESGTQARNHLQASNKGNKVPRKPAKRDCEISATATAPQYAPTTPTPANVVSAKDDSPREASRTGAPLFAGGGNPRMAERSRSVLLPKSETREPLNVLGAPQSRERFGTTSENLSIGSSRGEKHGNNKSQVSLELNKVSNRKNSYPAKSAESMTDVDSAVAKIPSSPRGRTRAS